MHIFSLTFALSLLWQPAVVPPAVVFPEHVQEYERLLLPMLAKGSIQKFTGAAGLADGQVVFTFGARAARGTTLAGRRVIEYFVAGATPLVEGHDIAPWEAPVEAHLFLMNRFAKDRGDRSFCVLATPRTRDWAGRLVSASGGLVTSLAVEDPSGALRLAADLIAGRRRCAGVLLTGDFEQLDWTALEVFVRLQVRLGIPVFARTRHEVLLGAAAAVEPRYESWDPLARQAATGQIFYHKHISAWLGVEEIVSPKWKPQPLAR